jgi:2-oxoglutarate ferredoxin oxidoreductase subunit beta
VAQGFAGNAMQLIDLIKKGIAHKGFSIVNVLQPCVTFNKINTYDYYRDKAYDLEEGYDPSDFKAAMEKALQPTQEEKFPLGVIYEFKKPTYTEQLPQLAEKQLIDRDRFTEFEKLI